MTINACFSRGIGIVMKGCIKSEHFKLCHIWSTLCPGWFIRVVQWFGLFLFRFLVSFLIFLLFYCFRLEGVVTPFCWSWGFLFYTHLQSIAAVTVFKPWTLQYCWPKAFSGLSFPVINAATTLCKPSGHLNVCLQEISKTIYNWFGLSLQLCSKSESYKAH